jgi:5'-3' exonuclease
MKKANVCVFHMGSLNESMILSLVGTPPVIDVQEIARQYCGQTIFVNWPHLLEAKVVSIANKEFKYSIGIDSLSNATTRPMDIQKNPMVPRDVDEWRSTEKEIRNR